MRLFIKWEKIDDAVAKNFKDFDICSNENRLPLNTINRGCAAANSIIDLNRQDQISKEEVCIFCKE